MSSLRLSYASSPESDLEHSPGPSGNNTTSSAHGQPGAGGGGQGVSAAGVGRLTKASSDPSVVMAAGDVGGGGAGGDMLPPYQPTYDTRYGFNHNPNNPASTGMSISSLQAGSEPQTPTSKDSAYLSPSSNTINNSSDPSLYGSKAPPAYSLNGVMNYEKADYAKTDPRNEFTGDFSGKSGHKRQSSNVTQHVFTNHMKGLSISDHPKDIIYGTAPDLPPRIDRAVKPTGLTTTPTKTSNGRSAHERLFGAKASSNIENNNESPNLSNDPNFNNKLSSLDRNQNSKSDSLSSYDSFNNPTTKHNASRIIPNAHDDLKTTLSKIDPNAGIPNSTQSTPGKYQRWDTQQQIHHASQTPNHNRHDRLNSKLDLKYSMCALPPNLDLSNISHLEGSPRNSRELEKDMGSLEGVHGGSRDRDYRYSRSPGKHQQAAQMMQQSQGHMETRTDYGKYSRNNTVPISNPTTATPSNSIDYPSTPIRASQQDLSTQHLSIHSPAANVGAPQHHHHHNNNNNNNNQQILMKMSTPPSHHNGYGGGGGGGGGVDPQQIALMQQQQGQNQAGGYKPVPPPKPKNYKPPYRSGSGHGQQGNSFGPSDGVMQPPLPYQHNKSHSNPVDQRTAAHMHLNPNGHNYYYNMPHGQGQGQGQLQQANGPWHTETAVRYNSNQQQLAASSNQLLPSSPYDLPPSYDPNVPSNHPTATSNAAGGVSRRHTSISYASRSEIAPLSTTNASQQQQQQQQQQQHQMMAEYDGDAIDTRMHQQQGGQGGIVDLQGSREQRGSAFELYRKPLHHNMMRLVQGNADQSPSHNHPIVTSHLYGSQPNLANSAQPPHCNGHEPPPNVATLSPANRKLAKAQSFKHARASDGGLGTPKFLRRMFGKNRGEKKANKVPPGDTGTTNRSVRDKQSDLNRNSYVQATERDVTSAIVGEEGATLVNHYWGVSLEIPDGAISPQRRQEVYFVITDPRLCDNAPPLDLDNGERMLSPLVMCGPQGLEFKKPVVLNIPHYANTLPSLGISLKATDSEADICTDWENILLPSNHAANSVAVKVDHF